MKNFSRAKMTGNEEVNKSRILNESGAKERDEKMRVIWFYKLFANSGAFHSLTTLSLPTTNLFSKLFHIDNISNLFHIPL